LASKEKKKNSTAKFGALQQVNLDDVDEEDVPMAAIRTIAIRDVRPQEQKEQDQPYFSTMVHPPTDE
jgi:hypothetical protein